MTVPQSLLYQTWESPFLQPSERSLSIPLPLPELFSVLLLYLSDCSTVHNYSSFCEFPDHILFLKFPIPFLISNDWLRLLCTPGNVNWLCPHTAALGAKPGLVLAPWIWLTLIHCPHMICTKFVYCTLPTGSSQLWLPCHIPVSSSGYSHTPFLSSCDLSHLSPG